VTPPPTIAATDELQLPRAAARTEVLEAKKTIPVKAWAGLGAVILAFEAFVIVKWLTGPYFERVKVGPSDVPDWMHISLRVMEVGFVSLWLWCVWHFFVQPWRKERRFTFDGLLCMALLVFAWFQDPLADYGGAVFTYNSDLVNMGSWLNEVPGATVPGHPGAQLSEPLWTMAIYPGVIFLATILGCGFMRKIKERRPQISPLGLIGTAFVFFVFFDFVLEALILMPLGAYTYAGAPDWISINDSHYFKYTFVEGIGFGAVWTCWASLRYFKNDKGETIAERGIDELKMSSSAKAGLRFLAIGAFIAVTMALCVNVPFYWQANNSSEYPRDVQKRSYFTQGICGEGTTLACFGKAVPLPRGNDSARVGPDGRLYVPAGTQLPTVVPIDRGPLGPKGD
jgi:hypothetical protein